MATTYGLTSAGFIPRTQSDILAELQSTAQTPTYFGSSQDVSIYDPVGQMLAIMSDMLSEAWMGLEDTYYNWFPATASGVSLDRVVAFGGITRIPAQSATVLLTASGTNGTIIGSSGFYAQTAQGIRFQNISSGIVSSGIASFYAAAVLPGNSGIVPAGSINQISIPFAGITGVSNSVASSGGSEIETDVALYQRFLNRSVGAGSSLPAITAALQQVAGATSVYVEENITQATLVDGTPPHTIHCVVGGYATSSDIAYAIFNSKAGGIGTYGVQSYTVTDVNNQPHTIYWDTPTQMLVNVTVNITHNSAWLSSNTVLVQTATVKSIGGVDTVGSVSTQYPGVGMATNVYSWLVQSAYAGISGISNVEVLLAFSPSTPTLSQLTISASEYAWTQTGNITVTVS